MDFSFDASGALGKAKVFESHYDAIVVGAGPAGMSAAIYLKRKGLSTLIVTEKIGGQVVDTSSVENYAGFTSISGQGLSDSFSEHVKSLDIPIKSDVLVKAIVTKDNCHTVQLNDYTEISAHAIILATGSKNRHLGIPGEEAYAGKGVAYCAICDGPLYKDKPVIIAGGGNSAVEAAIDLAKTSSHVTLVHRSQFRADQILLDQLDTLDNVDVHLQTTIQSVEGEHGIFKGITAVKNGSEEPIQFTSSALFVEIGYVPNTEFLKGIVDLTSHGEVMIDEHFMTNVSGIFAAGDVTTVQYKQIIISAGQGAHAALAASDYINRTKRV